MLTHLFRNSTLPYADGFLVVGDKDALHQLKSAQNTKLQAFSGGRTQRSELKMKTSYHW